MKQYLDMLRHILAVGEQKGDRTGTGTLSTFGYQMRFDLREGFPIITTKKMYTKGIIHELLWFLKGDTNIKYLVDNGVDIWIPDAYREYKYNMKKKGIPEAIILTQDEFKDKIKTDNHFAMLHGNLGPVYGKQWRKWDSYDIEPTYGNYDRSTIDQIANLIRDIQINPNSRRLIVSAWNVADIEDMALPPCHCLFQFYVSNGRLDCQLYQRSADAFLGVPFNISSYALLIMMVAQVCNLTPGYFVHTFGDLHIYNNHLDQVNLQLSREPHDLPEMHINPEVKDIFSFKYEDFLLDGYVSHPAIKGNVSV